MQHSNGWTLFLDRDGVLNQRPGKDYVRHPDDFTWIEGSLEALAKLFSHFKRIIVVTNQQGIAKGLMTLDRLDDIHARMLQDVNNAGGRIDKVYCADGLRHADSFMRKPGEGMFLQAKNDFPDIEATKSIMVGDTFTDMLFGHRLKMLTVLISRQSPLVRNYHHIIDYQFNNLLQFANFIKSRAPKTLNSNLKTQTTNHKTPNP